MEWMRGVDHNTEARLVAYKAHKLGRDSKAHGTSLRDEELARSCIAALEREEMTGKTLLIRLFYSLVIAEIHRTSDPVPDRVKAQALGQNLSQMGLSDPFPLYMKIIATTTNSVTAGNFGDLKTRGARRIQDSTTYIDRFGEEVAVDLAQQAVGLSGAETDAHWLFLGTSLQDFAGMHLTGE